MRHALCIHLFRLHCAVTEKIQAFATLPPRLQTYTKQPKNTQPEGFASSTPKRREGAHGLPVLPSSGL